ncbi:hypothetical protein [Streptomyces goshikiensis]|uniref:hypothetical protein n=1 Tax=Streptomyces goshikiensis TaxID=1942 RepID=UPI002E10AF0F|nr:hypothetical protein OG224_06895 [Streptomyces goshikiensis]
MSASQVAGACITTVLALILLASWALDRRIKRSTRRRFQRTARQAARTEADVRSDLAAVKARRAQIQAQFDEQFEQIIAGYQANIPHQIRRTEEDQ